MSLTTPLTVLADQTKQAAAKARADQEKALAKQDADLPGLSGALAAATQVLANDAAREAELRRLLSLIELPSDSDPIVVELENLLVDRQRHRATADSAVDALGAAQQARARTAARLAAATAAVGTTAQQALREHEIEKDVEAWSTAAGAPAVAAAKAAAQAARNQDPYRAAFTRIKSIVDVSPADTRLSDLFARRGVESDERDSAVTGSLARAENVAQDVLTADHPVDAAVAKAGSDLRVAVAALRQIAENLLTRHTAAMAALTAIAAPPGGGPPTPTQPEQDAIDAAAPAAAGAAHLEITVHDKQRILRAAVAALDGKSLVETAKDPLFDPTISPVVQAERTAVGTARADVAAAVAALVAGQNALDVYEAALPDRIKQQIVAFLAAGRVLDEVAAVDVPARRQAVATTATALATARKAAQARTASTTQLAAAVADRRSAAQSWGSVADARRGALISGEAGLS